MKITDIQARKILLPIAEPEVKYPPMPKWFFYVSIILQVYTDEGIVGVSEAEGFPTRTTAEPDLFDLLLSHFKNMWIGEDPFQIERIIGDAYYDERPSEKNWLASVIEIACWDIIGKKLNQPIYNLLGGKIRDKAEVTRFMGIRPPEQASKDAAEAIDRWGVKTIKLKIGREPTEDVEIVKEVRKAVGDDVHLRVDANGCYSAPMAINQVRKMMNYYPQFFEDPTNTIEGMKRVKNATGVPIAVCGAVWDPKMGGNHKLLMRLIREEVMDFIHIDPRRTQGILGWKKMDALCSANDICMVTHWAHNGVATAIALQAIAFSRSCQYAHDLLLPGIPPGSEEDIITKPFKVENGSVKIPDEPGLGVELDEEKMERAEKNYQEYIKRTPSARFATKCVCSFDLPRGTDRRAGVPDRW